MKMERTILRYFCMMFIVIGLLIRGGAAWALPPAGNVWAGGGEFATGLGNRVINAIAIDPTNPNIIYVGTGSDSVLRYAAVKPSVMTTAATGVGTSSATLNATVNANNGDTAVTFEYGLTTSYGSTIAGDPGTATGTSDISVTAGLTGLTPGTYQYRVVAVNSAGISYGDNAAFTIAKLNQTITFDPLAPKTYGDAPFTVSGTGGGSGNPVTFSIFSGHCDRNRHERFHDHDHRRGKRKRPCFAGRE